MGFPLSQVTLAIVDRSQKVSSAYHLFWYLICCWFIKMHIAACIYEAVKLMTIRLVEVWIQTYPLSSLSLYFGLPLLLNLY